MSEDKDLRPAQEEPAKPEKKSIQGARKQNTRVFLWVICALYLLYLVSKLVKDLFAGLVTETSTKIMVICASVVFTGVAGVLLVVSIRHAVSSFKDSVKAMSAAEEEERAQEDAKRALEEEDAAYEEYEAAEDESDAEDTDE